jgi:acetoin utilization protein AcuB
VQPLRSAAAFAALALESGLIRADFRWSAACEIQGMKAIPTIRKYMTTTPHTVGRDQSLSFATKILRDNNIRHLPVLEGGKLVGILSERDVALVAALKDVDPEKVEVGDAMSQQVFTVRPDSPLDEVADEMASHKFGSALVIDNGKVVGVFTTVDAMQALSELLKGRLSK